MKFLAVRRRIAAAYERSGLVRLISIPALLAVFWLGVWLGALCLPSGNWTYALMVAWMLALSVASTYVVIGPA